MSTDRTGNTVHYATIAGKIPQWMKNAPKQTLQTLRDAQKKAPEWLEKACRENPEVAKALAQEHALYREHQAEADKLLENFKSLEEFASHALTEAISTQFKMDVDVSRTYLLDAVLYSTVYQRDRGPRNPELCVKSLKHYAMQNFEASATEPGGMDAYTPAIRRSVILDQRGYQAGPPFENIVDIEPEQFAALCRTLDIGGNYYAQLDSLYYPTPKPGENALEAQAVAIETLGRPEVCALKQSLHLAYLKNDISKAMYDAVLVTPLEEQAAWSNMPSTFAFLHLWDVELTGLVLISLQQPGVSNTLVVALYNPHDTDTPIKEYASFEALCEQLRDRLQQDMAYIARHIPDASKSTLTVKLQDRLLPLTFTRKNIYERVPDPQATLPLVPRAFERPFLAEMVYQGFVRHRDDARFHAVPTLAMDAKTLHRRLAYIESIALDALNVVAFVVPEVGYLMLATTVLQLGNEVYEGIESWSNDDKEIAFGYMMDVVENVSLLLLQGLGATAVAAELGGEAAGTTETPGPERIPVETPSFIEELEDVEMPDGETRLWKPDLAPFVQDTVIPAGLEPDELGLRHYNGKALLLLEGKAYAVKQTSAADGYRIEHPTKTPSYEPPIRHNGAGAWIHGLDQPQEWQGMRLFRRLGHRNAQFSDETALQILRVSGIDEGVLRRVLSENQRLPAQLEDTMKRFQLDKEVMQSLPEAEASIRNAEFEQRYRLLPAIQAPTAEVIQRVYPQLPPSVTEELLRNARSSELQALNSAKVPKRLAEEIRLYQQQVRLTRAYEGLYLASVRNLDTDRLILHTLKTLPGWSPEVRIELHQFPYPRGPVDSIGPEAGGIHILITSTPAGYVASHFGTPNNPAVGHGTIYGALFEALPESQRTALASSGVTDAITLKEHIQQAPLLPRWRLRKILGMQRPGFRSPMRLADGRLGYPLSGEGNLAGAPSRTTLLAQINDSGLPQRITVSAEQILARLEQDGRSSVQIQDRIGQLIAERQELQDSLAQWRAGPGVIADLASRESSRQEIEEAIWQQWFHSAVPELNQALRPLRLQQVLIAEFPGQLPDFIAERTRHLQLSNLSLDHSADGSLGWTQFEAQLRNMFQHFPHLERLEIERPYNAGAQASELSNSLELIVRSFPQLTELRFVNQNLVLTPQDIERLATREHLSRLDLSGNTLDQGPSFRLPDWQLSYLGLERMRFERWPTWLDSNALERIGELSLRTNSITVMPDFLVGNEASLVHHTLVSLDGNAIFPSQLRDLYLSQDGRQRRFSFNLALPVPVEERLLALMDERQALRDAVDQWANASSSSAPLSHDVIHSRNQVAEVILDFWERRARGALLIPLHLEDLSLGDFPSRLPRFFYRYVEHLRLRRVAAPAEQLNQFLRRFPALSSLTLEGHVQPLRSLPAALLESDRISELNLREQGLVVDQALANDLARMRGLIALDLSGNSFSPDLQSPIELSRPLHRLYLRSTGLQSWPEWLNDIMPLYVLALDDNLLTELPEPVLNNPENDDGFTSISLTGNPLNNDTMQRAHLSQGRHRSYTFDMDLPLEILNLQPLDYHSDSADSSPGSSPGSVGSSASAHRHSPVPWLPGDVPNVELWLQGSEQMRTAHRSQWQTLDQGADATDLLNLVGRLSQSAPYRTRTSRSEFIDRVWRVLDMATDMGDQRQLFNGMAQDGASSRTCHDGALLVFKQIEEQLLIRQVETATPGADHDQYMYRLTRRLYRQRELDNIAREQAGDRDEAELRLVYHRRLATTLDLPTPADHMLYESAIRLNRGELENVERRVREGERGESFLRFATHFSLWETYLRGAHAERFEEITSAYHEGERRLFERFPDESLEALGPYIQALRENMENQERALLRELTNQAGRRQD
ncbi:NEL-type E3 ubiquitin ligase domain-containing protein [Pseudomonas alkylphenolica]|uniref:NEL-type E3 ubiquitin ligase domain-containing protein n=1 Tax=Pseudomonas alkylphenolica TaxID=237609 RepID=UPI00315DE19E